MNQYPYPPYGPGPGTPAPQPVQAPCPPPFAVRQPRDPRLTGASKTLNRMCLLVLLQTAASFVWTLLFEFILLAAHVDFISSPMAFQWLSTVLVPLSTALPFFVYLLIERADLSQYLRFERVGFGMALLWVMAGLAVCLLGNFPAIAVQDFFSRFGYEPTEMGFGEKTLPLFILELLSTAVLVPVMEEFAFRGVLLSALRKYGVGFAITASALVFSLVHLDFSNVVFALIAGLVFGFLYVKTGNLWISILIHAFNNAIAVIGNYEEFLFPPDLIGLLENLIMFVPLGLGLIALIILIACRRRDLLRLADRQETPAPLTGGEAAASIVRAPLLWVVVATMAAYTVTLFL